MKTKTVMMILALAVLTAAMAQADDDAIKKQLLGYWKTSAGTRLLKDDGIVHVLPRSETPVQTWDVRNGVFITRRGDRVSFFKIISLSKAKFVLQDQADGHHTGTWIRITAAEGNQ